eukprot:TRINITY_DN6692_c0_g2_i1.p1 TRINITY_DN6692_c0_g2~~TRINITY_DN6692_c0_g2_i1.p1  ORF type:complete len:742 (-),score=191.23 TRINITY_DN6692_c0_g2_i1:324-2549(-)
MLLFFQFAFFLPSLRVNGRSCLSALTDKAFFRKSKVFSGEINRTMAIVDPDDSSITHVKEIDATDPHMDLQYFPNNGLRTLGSAGEVLTRVDLDLAYSSEKLLNLKILFMHVAERAGDCESMVIDDEFVLGDSAEKVLEFDILSGILYSEVKELDDFMTSLQEEIMDAREKISSCVHLKEAFVEIEEKLLDSEESLKQLQEQVDEMRMQSAKFQSFSVFGGLTSCNSGISEISHLSSMHHNKMKTQTSEQQRHILKMLEKSLARELDLEKWLSESRHNEEELKLKLHHTEQEMEELVDLILERLFEAENVAEVLICISKELTRKLQIVQFNLNISTKREGEVRARLQDSIQKLSTENTELQNLKVNLKKTEDECFCASTEALNFKEKVISLEENLMESDVQLQNAKATVEASQVQEKMLNSKIIDLETLIENLRADVLRTESRAVKSESQCKSLIETNSKVREELNSLSSREMEKVSLLENKLRQSETQLQHAKALLEASQEQQQMFFSALSDMENLIEDLKAKALKAEGRAESAEDKCILLTETNLELNEELGFLKGKVECLEMSLREAENVKMAIANDIGVRTKVISNLVKQLTMERERLDSQVSSLTKENKILVEKLWKGKNDDSLIGRHNANLDKKEFFPKSDSATAQCLKSFEESVTEASSTSFQVDRLAKDIPTCESEVGSPVAAEDSTSIESKFGTVRKTEAKQLNSKYIFLAVFILMISMAAVLLFQLESCPF